MDEAYFYSTSVSNDLMLCISPLTNREAEVLGCEENAGGYYLYERRRSSGVEDIMILAQIPTEEAVFALSRLLNMD